MASKPKPKPQPGKSAVEGRCNDESKDGFVCSLPPGHDLNHKRIESGKIIAEWPNPPAPQPEPEPEATLPAAIDREIAAGRFTEKDDPRKLGNQPK